ncbi:MAG: Nif3-like dinuclear metal center hexameric protein [Sphingobacteriales bacterium]|nr:Nif3-like dinuclear metal center hexameric protein [Sphingobacteriales bacterium]MBI3717070.1 Nif3-like dinuclear metal center hexameric protein [Sphingobacteriales bacterium]
MKIAQIIQELEATAPLSLQESYDNAGLLTGMPQWECTGVLCTLDATEEVVNEAIERKCNLIVAHHPIIFGGLKKINGKNYVERAVITAIKNGIAIYAIHTNLDNVSHGVNKVIADKLGLINTSILSPKENLLKKLFVFVPIEQVEKVRDAIFNAGAGNIGNYSECSFGVEGTGTFKANEGADPFVGEVGSRHYEKEVRIEGIFPAWLENKIISAIIKAHPYEEVAYDVVALDNFFQKVGSGMIGHLPEKMDEQTFLTKIKSDFGLSVIRHTPLTRKPVQKVAVCGGAGSFLISRALNAGADFYITADVKYHEFFDANGRMVIADIGHFESEQYTIDFLAELLVKKFPTFAVLKSEIQTNPVQYFT